VIGLGMIAVVEAVVYLVRIRTAAGASAWRSGVAAAVVCLVRLVFVVVGAGLAIDAAIDTGGVIAAAAVYAGAAGLCTWAVHAILERQGGQGEGRDDAERMVRDVLAEYDTAARLARLASRLGVRPDEWTPDDGAPALLDLIERRVAAMRREGST
jgi:hypothetical protein